jgi:neutral ceramidase
MKSGVIPMWERFLVLAALWSAVPASTFAEHPPDPFWQAGAAKVVITPAQPMWMSGYGARNKPAEGKIHDLWAKALALEDPAGERLVLVTMDLVGIDRGLSEEVCRGLMRKHGLRRGQIMLSTSHTHSGPVVGSNLGPMYQLDDAQKKLVIEYSAALRTNLIEVAGKALGRLAPARLQWATGHCSVAVNRRNNKEKEVPALRAAGKLLGPVDHDVPVLGIYDTKDRLLAITFGYACHATVLDGYQWCGDYPGFAQLELEQRHPGAIALFWAGCGGDPNPLPRRSVLIAEKYGNQLADSVDLVLNGAMTPVDGTAAATYKEIALPFSELPQREQLVQDTMSKNKFVVARAKLLLQELEKQGAIRGQYPYPVQTWQLGNGPTWVALGGEVVVDYALRLKKQIEPGRTWVAGYCNDVMAYIPSLRVLKEGGYEGREAMVYYGLPTAWGPRVEELIVGEVMDQVHQLGPK